MENNESSKLGAAGTVSREQFSRERANELIESLDKQLAELARRELDKGTATVSREPYQARKMLTLLRASMDLTLPEGGTVAHFTRESVSDAEMEEMLEIFFSVIREAEISIERAKARLNEQPAEDEKSTQ